MPPFGEQPLLGLGVCRPEGRWSNVAAAYSSPRVAELIASQLREDILSGRIKEETCCRVRRR